MTKPLPKFIPAGRLSDLRDRDDAHLIAYTIPRAMFADYAVKRYNSRAALEAFCKAGSSHYALVRNIVAPTMLVNRNIERAG